MAISSFNEKAAWGYLPSSEQDTSAKMAKHLANEGKQGRCISKRNESHRAAKMNETCCTLGVSHLGKYIRWSRVLLLHICVVIRVSTKL